MRPPVFLAILLCLGACAGKPATTSSLEAMMAHWGLSPVSGGTDTFDGPAIDSLFPFVPRGTDGDCCIEVSDKGARFLNELGSIDLGPRVQVFLGDMDWKVTVYSKGRSYVGAVVEMNGGWSIPHGKVTQQQLESP